MNAFDTNQSLFKSCTSEVMSRFACLEIIETEIALEISWYDSDDTYHHFIHLRLSNGGSYTQSRRNFRTIVISY